MRLLWMALSFIAAGAFVGWAVVLAFAGANSVFVWVYAVPATWSLVMICAAIAYSRLQGSFLLFGGIPLPFVTFWGLLWGDPVVFLVMFIYSLACVFGVLDAESRPRSSHA